MGKISLVIITFNRPEKLYLCILSCIKNYNELFSEIIVIDDNSSEDYKPWISKIKESKIIYIKNADNLGPGKSRNIGFNKAQSESVLFLDDDVELTPSSNLIELKSTLFRDNNTAITTGLLYDVYSDKYFDFKDSKKRFSKDKIKYESFSFPGAFNMVKKSLLEKPLYNSNIKFGFEEIFLSYKLHNKNLKIVVNENCKAIHNSETRQIPRIDLAIQVGLYTRLSNFPRIMKPIIYFKHYLRIIKYYGINLEKIKLLSIIDDSHKDYQKIDYFTLFKILFYYKFNTLV